MIEKPPNTFNPINVQKRKARSLYKWLTKIAGVNACWIEGIDEQNHPVWGIIKRITANRFLVKSRFAKAAASLVVLSGALLFPTNPLQAQTGIDLINLTGANGFALHGVEARDESGFSLASGDVNGDGIDDVIIGAHQANPNASNSGETYVVFGKTTVFADTLELSSLDGSTGFTLNGVDGNDLSGTAVASGDINGDGIADIIIGAPQASPNGGFSGETYVVFGKSTAFDSIVELSSLDGSNGFVLNGVASNDESGDIVTTGDINGDGKDDVIIVAPGSPYNGGTYYGNTHVAFGFDNTSISTLELSSLDGSNGFTFAMYGYNYYGWNVASGDINGDGEDDLIIGAPGIYGFDTYVMFGKSTPFAPTVQHTSLDGSTGFVLSGVDSDDLNERTVASGDINGDGKDDVIIGLGEENNSAGETYVVFGFDDTTTDTLVLSTLDGSTGFIINGVEAGDQSGVIVASGDINGDTYNDVIIGAIQANPNEQNGAGATYVVFGKSTAFASIVELSSLDGSTGFVLNGIASNDQSGYALASGDINGDGADDVIIGAHDANIGENLLVGETYVFTQLPAATELTGSEGFHILAVPTSGSILDEFLKPIWTQGFTGSDDPDGTNNVWVWDETVGAEGSWSAISNLPNQDMARGLGFLTFVFSDDDFDGADDGFPKKLNTIDIFNSAVMDTGTVNPVSNLGDGRFFLVGNPYLSTFDWDSTAVSKTNLSNTIYIYDAAGSVWRTWNGTAGDANEGEVAPFEGFFIQGMGGSGSLSIGEGAISDPAKEFRRQIPADPKVLKIQAEAGGFTANAWLSFQQGGQVDRDAFDGLALQPLTSKYLQLATVVENQEYLQINALPIDQAEEIILPLSISGAIEAETAEVTFEGLEDFEEWSIVIRDLQTGEEYQVNPGLSLELDIQRANEKAMDASPAVPNPIAVKSKPDGLRFQIVLIPNNLVSNETEGLVPVVLELQQNYPNPFNPVTTINYQVPQLSRVRLEVFDLMGRKVATLVNSGQQQPGRYVVRFDASQLASGTYIYRLTAGSTSLTKKLTLIK